jgi:hypothetical protein
MCWPSYASLVSMRLSIRSLLNANNTPQRYAKNARDGLDGKKIERSLLDSLKPSECNLLHPHLHRDFLFSRDFPRVAPDEQRNVFFFL